MVRRMNISMEQAGSLAAKLQEAGHEHGDESELELVGVGVKSEGNKVHLAFCPTQVMCFKALQRGSAEERCQPLPRTLKLSRSSQRRIGNRLQNFHGFATVRCKVHSNGTFHLKELHVMHTQRYSGPVNTPYAYDDYKASLVSAAS